MVIEYIGQLIRNEVAEMREKIYEKQVTTDLQLAWTSLMFCASVMRMMTTLQAPQFNYTTLFMLQLFCML